MQSEPNIVFQLVLLSSVIILAFLFFVVYVLLVFNKKQNILKKNLEITKLNEHQNILNAQLEIQENTFRKISEEIHDNISLSLTLAKLNLNTCNRNDPKSIDTAIESSIDLISKSLIDLNDISKSLDGDLIEQYGLIHTLEYEKYILQRSGTHSVNIWIDGIPEYLPAAQELLIFRMIQEAANNIIKHAAANQINIRLNYSNATLIVTVSDNGRGFPTAADETRNGAKRTSGLKNIRSRAALMDADVTIESQPGKGSKITIKIPIRKNVTP